MLQDGLWELGETPDSLNMCHHPDAGQLLTTTDAPASPLIGVCGRKVEKEKILR